MSGIRPVSMATYTPPTTSYISNVNTESTVNEAPSSEVVANTEPKPLAPDDDKDIKDKDTADKKSADRIAEEKLTSEKVAEKRRELLDEILEEASGASKDSKAPKSLNGMSVDDIKRLYAQKKISRRVYDQEIAKREQLAEATTEKQNFELWEQGFDTAVENGRADVVKDIINPQNS